MDLLKDLREDSAMYLLEMGDVEKITANEVMIRPSFLHSGDNSNKILKRLKKERINACIVVDKNKRFIGMIEDNDIIKLFLHQVKYEPLVKILDIGYRKEIINKKAKDLINKKHTITVNSETPINEVIKMMCKENFAYIPVVNEKKEVIGVITPSCIIALLRRY